MWLWVLFTSFSGNCGYTMKALVTGANGFIGSHLVKQLKKLNHEVETITHQKLRTLSDDYDADQIYFLSSYGNMAGQTGKEEIFAANVDDFVNLTYHLSKRPKAIVYVSSSSVLLSHKTDYATAKMIGEGEVSRHSKAYELPSIAVRPYSVYGPGEADFRLIPTICRSIITGEQMMLSSFPVHDWIYVDDVVDGMMHFALKADAYRGLVFNLGTEIQTSNLQILFMLEKISGKRANVIINEEEKREYDSLSWVADTSYSRSLGWEAKTVLEDGLAKTYAYYERKYSK